jgi:HEAT repeat protein
MKVSIALRWIAALACGAAIAAHAIAAEAKDEKAKATASKSDALTPGRSFATGEDGRVVPPASPALGSSTTTAPRNALTPGPSPVTGEGSAGAAAAKKPAEAVAWLSNLNDGYRRALADRKPILIRVGAKWSADCRKLAATIETPEVQAELARWTPVCLDVDAQSDDVAELAISGVPAMRIRTPSGQHIAQHDGYLAAGDLVDWLKENYEAATKPAADVLLASGEPTAVAATRLVHQFQERNPALREAAIRRLLPYPSIARSAVLRAFTTGSLTSRLAAMEVLEHWKAPLEGLDPWRPETFTDARLERLDKWKDREIAAEAPPKELSKEQLAAARRQIERMLAADESEADAIRQRLAEFGPALLPEVYAWLKNAAADQDRRRLLILRYRLAANDALVLRWPGGVERLGDTDPRQRRRAAEELARTAGDDEKPLLLELFADSDPLVRELSLRGLQHIGGDEAKAALVKLLGDPEPNVRAAVLKQLEESPDAAMVPAVVKYLKDEKDPDLIVHGIGVLRAAKGKEAIKCLMSLLKHKSWQVRAEAAAGIGKLDDRSGVHFSSGWTFDAQGGKADDPAAKLQADAYVALLDLLDDEDGFVVAKAVEGLSEADMSVAVEPLVKVATKHPDLAANVLKLLAEKGNMRKKAIPHLRKFCKHELPTVRAAAIAALCAATSGDAEDELSATLADQESEVRIAAAAAFFKAMDQLREASKNKAESGTVTTVTPSETIVVETETLGNGEVRTTRTVTRSGPTVAEEKGGAAQSSGIAEKLSSKVAALLGGGQSPPAPRAATLPTPSSGKKSAEKPANTKLVDTVRPAEKGKSNHEKKPAVKKIDKKAGKKSDEKTEEEELNPQDQWLLGCYAGKGRPKWTSRMVAPLEKMLKADAAKERMAAAAALVPLGKAAIALPVALATVRADRDLIDMAAEILPWLVWQQRMKAFQELCGLAGDGLSRARLIMALAQSPDRRAAEPLWAMLANAKASDEGWPAIYAALMVTYLGNQYSPSNISASDRRDLSKAAKPRAEAGNERQRLVALALLAQAVPDDAAALAARLADDPKLSDSLRNDAFQIELLTRSAPAARKLSLETMHGGNVARKRLAMIYLIHGARELWNLHDGIYLLNALNSTIYSSRQSGTPIVPKPPEGLTLDDVRPLVGDANAEAAACAGYLMALLGDTSGMEPLLQYWRQHNESSSEWKKLVYRAIAVSDDPKYIPVLREIYGKLDQYEMSEFYWTIRIMTGSEILAFRKQIRDEVGAAQLSQ